MNYKLGKLPARPGAVKLKFGDYVDMTKLPPIPVEFGHERLVGDWGMLANDQVGDCAIAGALHETLLWNKEAGKTVNINDGVALQNYSDVTGYNGDPSTDNGTDVAALASYRRNTGLIDADGKRHKIGAYVALQPGNLTELWYATRFFDGVGIGVRFPEQWHTAFQQGRPWDTLANPNFVGGHYITAVAKRGGNAVIISWGQPVQLTGAGYQLTNDETFAYLTWEKLVHGKDLEGLNWSQLRADLTAVAHA